MELREEAWSPGPLDSEDQQMASHENPGEVALGSSQLIPYPFWTPASFSPLLWLRSDASFLQRVTGALGGRFSPSVHPLHPHGPTSSLPSVLAPLPCF